jgi:uncharacterized protein YjiS (DUF1127 family)
MTYTTDLFHSGVRFREWLEAFKKAATEHHAQRSAYIRTLHDLQSSSDRDLADIGISRLSIKEIAYDAAYGDPRSQAVNRRI